MAGSFFFYDLETSGVDPRKARIMQFAGQRTDMDLNPIGEPYDILIKLSDDVLPEPDAIMITGITPQKTLADGISEAEFVKLFLHEIVQTGTIFVGFNSVRFDDEFMRFLLYRNFGDAYEWQWKNSCSRWDMLDVARMTRALRPEGIQWPFAPDGKPSNRLGLLTKLNKLDHANEHDALSDVKATIAVARLIKEKQPKLFDYLLKVRTKKEVAALVETKKPFVYTSGKYSAAFEKTTVAVSIGAHPDRGGAFVYDLRHDPTPFLAMSATELAEVWKYTKDVDALRLPVKVLRFNRCPALAPLGVLTTENKQRLEIDEALFAKHHAVLTPEFYKNVCAALEILNTQQADQSQLLTDIKDVDAMLYDKFLDDGDRVVCEKIRNAGPKQLTAFAANFHDDRMKKLLPLYKARNFPAHLSEEERAIWEEFRMIRLKKQLPGFVKRLQDLGQAPNISGEKEYLLQELQLYAESIVPEALVG